MHELGSVDRLADAPPFRQIADQLRRAIQRGDLEPGGRVPSEAELIEHYGVARMTVRQAVAELKAEGLVIAEHGRGVFVRSRPTVRRLASDRFARRHREAGKAAFLAETESLGTPGVDQLEVSQVVPSERVAERLKLRKTAKVVCRDRRYLIDDIPVELATTYVPLAIARGLGLPRRTPVRAGCMPGSRRPATSSPRSPRRSVLVCRLPRSVVVCPSRRARRSSP